MLEKQLKEAKKAEIEVRKEAKRAAIAVKAEGLAEGEHKKAIEMAMKLIDMALPAE